ncbi:antibiotic biosynthesis monooxygenase [Fodinibius sp. AD559]|uniref:antibiotic biosynthesis monooxygenase n=1 Tax=Fodinibius sp. AD559 TaxID=3424179 RepID=UPI0040468EC1
MICRIWHGWTTHENASEYEQLLRDEVLPGIAEKEIDGYKSFQLLRRPHEEEVEFITIMSFDSWDGVKEFAGEDYEHSYVPANAKKVLKRYDDHAQHYEVTEHREYK